MQITHMNFGWLHAPPFPPACCHCLLVQANAGVALVDTGIGLQDIADPEARIGRDAIDAAGFQFLPEFTAIRQLEKLNIRSCDVTDIVLTHCDPDHAGGLADFPNAKVHLSAEEKSSLDSCNPRYSQSQFSHSPAWAIYDSDDCDTFGVPSRRVESELPCEIRLVPLFGHTPGHCGVAIENGGQWTLHVGDAYYLRDELSVDDHPVDELAKNRADDNSRRVESLSALRELTARKNLPMSYFGYHDVTELPEHIQMFESAV